MGRSLRVDLRAELERVFEGRAFVRPLFYGYPGGLRLELSQGGSAVEQFLTALDKARRVCEFVFQEAETLTFVGCVHAFGSRFRYRRNLRALRSAGIRLPRDRSLWIGPAPSDSMQSDADSEPDGTAHLAFQVPRRLLPNLLWCALGGDQNIEPNPGGWLYLADLQNRVLVLPYDDRGMDIVGPNHGRLAEIYGEFRAMALAYDKATMEATFGVQEPRTTWNYRVMQSGDEFAIHEVFYAEDGSVQGCTETPVFPRAESAQALRDELAHYALALDAPVLPYEP